MDLTRRRLVMLVAAANFSQTADPQRSQAQPQQQAELGATELRIALNGLVKYEVVRRGAALAEDAVKKVDFFVGDGVSKLVERKEIGNSYAVSITIDGARLLGAEIVNQATRVGANLRQIGADGVQAARNALCPMFPFC